MSISKSDKEYWTEYLQEEIDKKVRVTLKDTPNFMDQVKLVARDNVIADMGLTEDMRKLSTLKKQSAEADLIHSKLNTEVNELSNSIVNRLKTVYPKATSGGYYQSGVGDNMEKIVNSLVRETIEGMEGAIPEEVARLMSLKDTIERTIMLATGPSQLTKFVQCFMETNGIS